MCELLVGLADMDILGVDVGDTGLLRSHGRSRLDQAWCAGCGCRGRIKDRARVELVDLPCFGRPTRFVWHKVRWWCPEPACEAGSWTTIDERVAPPRAVLTVRAARWATRQVGKSGRSVAEVAAELGCDWHTVNDVVVAYGEALLAADVQRCAGVIALGLDETLFMRLGARRTQQWATSVVALGDHGPARLLEVLPGRTAAGVSAWIDSQPEPWRQAIRWGTLDLSGSYRKVFDDSLPDATQVADPFHVVKHANFKLDECRRRVQNETLGHRGRKGDPLYRIRRLMTKAHERLDETGEAKLLGLLEAGDPRGEVRTAWHAKETIRSIYDIDDPTVAREFVAQLAVDLQDDSCPPEVRSLGRTLVRWCDQIIAWHDARVSNGPTEATNNLMKRIKRIGFGFRCFRHYRIRVLLYAGRPNWDLLATITPR
jgi:transposase